MRAIRYLVKNEESIESLCRVNLPFLICRSIDILLDNRSERVQALRLVRKLLLLSPRRFPLAVTHCLVAVAKDSDDKEGGKEFKEKEKDLLVRSCWATLTELTLINPENCSSAGGISAIIKCILQPNQSKHIQEALIGAILFVLNWPKSRQFITRIDHDLQHFVSPFTDVHSVMSTDSPELRESKFNSCKNVLLSILRSWPGIIFMNRIPLESDQQDNIPCAIESLINMLKLPFVEIQRFIMELIFELFYLPIPEWTNDIDVAIESCDPHGQRNESWHLFDNFIVGEGMSLLPSIVKSRQNLTQNYLALLLYAFVNCGLLDGLQSVIINSQNDCLPIQATILLGELLHYSSQLLPPELSQQCHSLPSLMSASSSDQLHRRKLAKSSISSLNKIHLLKQRGPVPYSLYLDQLIQFCKHKSVPMTSETSVTTTINLNSSCPASTFHSIHSSPALPSTSVLHQKQVFNADLSDLKHEDYYLNRDIELLNQSIRDTQLVACDNHHDWDWELIDSILKYPGEPMKKLEDFNHRLFIKKLINFYKPSSKLFSQINQFDEQAKIMVIVGLHLLDFLILNVEDVKSSEEFIDELMSDLESSFSQIAVENSSPNSILNPSKLLSNLSHNYFLFVGRMTSSLRGNKILEKFGIFQYLLDLISLSTHDVYMKLIVSSLDYTKEGTFSRTLLTKVLTCPSEESRLYSTNYLRILLRAGIQDFKKWAIELLVQQFYDKSPSVSLAAANILDEACDDRENLQALISLRPSLLHTGDSGLLLLTRYLSLPNGFKFLRDSNYLDYELKNWQKTYNYKYVKIVENLLNESFSLHRRGEDGSYGRRTEKTNANLKNAFLPPHLYGQLAQAQEGYDILVKEDCLSSLFQHINSPNFDSEFGVLQLKAALWAAGHVGSTVLGFPLIESNIIQRIIDLAAGSPVISIRGTAFFVLGLLGTTTKGSDCLQEFGWESIRHDHHDKFTLIKPKDNLLLHASYPYSERKYTWSISSTTTRLPDFNDIMTSRNDSIVLADFNHEIISQETYSGSLPSLIPQTPRTNHKKKISLPNHNLQDQIPRFNSFSPQHHKLVDPRPRSSSDCPNDKEEDSEVIWMHDQVKLGKSEFDMKERHDSGFVNNEVGLSPKTPKLRITPKRKTSEPGISLFYNSNSNQQSERREERSDSNESSQNSSSNKSRSGSFNDSTSGFSASSYESASLQQQNNNLNNNSLTLQRIRSNNLSPIASLSSISNSTQSTMTGTTSPGTTGTILRSPSSFGHFVTLIHDNLNHSYESIPSEVDIQGYNYLREVRRSRIQSLYPSYDQFSSLLKDGDVIKSDATSDGRSRTSTGDSMEKDNFDEEEEKGIDVKETKKFMGLALPVSMNYLFCVSVC